MNSILTKLSLIATGVLITSAATAGDQLAEKAAEAIKKEAGLEATQQEAKPMSALVGTAPEAKDIKSVELSQAEAIQAAFEENPDLKPFGIQASVQGKMVILQGVVDTAEQKALAEQIASKSEGIQAISNRLEVKAQ